MSTKQAFRNLADAAEARDRAARNLKLAWYGMDHMVPNAAGFIRRQAWNRIHGAEQALAAAEAAYEAAQNVEAPR